MRYLIAVVLFLAAPFFAFAESNTFFTIVSGDRVYTFMNIGKDIFPPALHVEPRELSTMREFAMRAFDRPFTPDIVRKEYYKITITDNIVWQGNKLVQYDYIPIDKDRFRHVVWLAADQSSLIKIEIYNNDDKLLFSGVCLQNALPIREPSRGLTNALNNDSNNITYNGFSIVYAEADKDGALRMIFTDGLNRFSLFRKRVADDKKNSEQYVLYGNNVFSNNIGDYKYTVVGSIPFESMKNATTKIDELIKKDGLKAMNLPVGGQKVNSSGRKSKR